MSKVIKKTILDALLEALFIIDEEIEKLLIENRQLMGKMKDLGLTC